MTVVRNIGKNTIGDGKKMAISMRGYERSTHNLDTIFQNTQAVGTLVPFYVNQILKSDTFDINLEAKVLTHPTVGPLFGSLDLQCHMFFAPDRLYISALHNNKLNVGLNMSTVKYPKLMNVLFGDETDKPTASDEFIQVHPSCLLNYLGISGWGVQAANNSGSPIKKRATAFLAYWDIVKNYYANRQEENAWMIGTPTEISLVTGGGNATLGGNMRPSDLIRTTTSVRRRPYTGLSTTSPNTAMRIYCDTKSIKPEDILAVVAFRPTLEASGYDSAQDKDFGEIRLLEVATMTAASTFNYYAVSFNKVPSATNTFITLRSIYIDVVPVLESFPLENIDTMREDILASRSNVEFQINEDTYAPYGSVLQRNAAGLLRTSSNQFGLALRTYNSDLLQNWINTDWIDGENGINAITSIDVSEGSFKIDTLNLAKKVYDMLNRVALSGGSYQDWLETVWDDDYHQRCEIPTFEGGMTKDIAFQEVVSNSASEDEPLGTLAGRGVIVNGAGGHMVVKVDEPGILMGICSIRPKIVYTQGNRWFNDLDSPDDLHKPALTGIGFQDITCDEMAWWTRGGSAETTNGLAAPVGIGKQTAWIKYQTDVNRAYGNFALRDNEGFMVLGRNYEMDETDFTIKDMTTYIDPSKFNYIFADTSLEAMNFWVNIGVRVKARRKMSAKSIPNL